MDLLVPAEGFNLQRFQPTSSRLSDYSLVKEPGNTWPRHRLFPCRSRLGEANLIASFAVVNRPVSLFFTAFSRRFHTASFGQPTTIQTNRPLRADPLEIGRHLKEVAKATAAMVVAAVPFTAAKSLPGVGEPTSGIMSFAGRSVKPAQTG